MLLPSLTTHLNRELREVVVDACVELVLAYLQAHLRTGPLPRGASSASLSPEMLRAQLTLSYVSAPALGSLDVTIATLIAAGLDGELVAWEVINRVSVKHEGLIHKECNRLARTLPDRSPEDLKGYGWAGLRVALRNYDPELGFAFSTYACPKINGAIRDGVRAESPIPKRLTTFLRKVNQAEEQLTQRLSRTPNYGEIADYIDASTREMALLPHLAPSASIEELSNPWGERTREPSCLIDGADPEASVVTAMRDEALRRAVDALPADEAVAVRLLMLEEMAVGEAAALVGIEARQLRMRKQRGLRALAPVMTAWLEDNQPVAV